MKLELKHLAPYLPYKLQCLAMGEGNRGLELQGFSDCCLADLHETGRTVCDQYVFEDVFPILRPLSELKVGCKIFIDMGLKAYGKLTDSEFDRACCDIKKEKGYDLIPHWMFQDLIKEHYDVFGLIDEKLAIDINKFN